MPAWFTVLAKVLSMLAQLVPLVEEQFGAAPGQGAEKRAAVLSQVREYVESSPAGSEPSTLTSRQRGLILALAEQGVHQIVAASNDAGVFTHGGGGQKGPESA